MKVIKVSFDVTIERSENDITETKLRKDMERNVLIYSRNNALCVDNLKLEQIGGDIYE